MFFRFVVTRKNENSPHKEGVFGPAYELLRSGRLTTAESDHLKGIILWFERNLPLPDRSKLKSNAIFWFKPDARELMHHVWDLVAILREHGHEVEFIKTARPGYVVYCDDSQIAAAPFRDTV